MPDAMTGSKQAKRLNGQIVPDYLSAGDWSGNLLAHCHDNMDMISEHYYSTGWQADKSPDRRKGRYGPASSD
jgi:alpha-N-arabinofuranosidase